MGQKVNPTSLRLALNKNWDSRWFAHKSSYGDWLHEDLKIRKFINAGFAQAAIAKIKIERFASRVRLTIFAARPGMLIGRKGAELDKIRVAIAKLINNKDIIIDIVEIKKAEICAPLVAQSIAMQLERRIGFRRAMKKSIQTAMDMGAEGIKIRCAGRLGGAELARDEQYKDGKTPLHTLRANIDYGFYEANTPAGKIGIKVWICHKELTEEQKHALNAKKSKAPKNTARK